MTEEYYRGLVIHNAIQYLGLKEGDERHKEILSIWNNYHDDLRRVHTMTIFDAWCMTFVSAMFIKSDLGDLIVTECGCGEAINRNWTYKNNWTESDAYVPNKGDIIMYDWDDTGAGDCTGWPEHTGIVVKCDGKTILVIEGNSNDTVQYREVPVNDRYIRGFITPNFASKASDNSGFIEMVDCYACYVRKGDNVHEEVIGVVHGGDILPYIEVVDNHWYKVKYGSDIGYISPKYVRPLTELTATGNLYVREKAGITNPIMKVNGEEIVIHTNEKAYELLRTKVLLTTWYKVYYKGHIGWASGKYLKESK